MKTVLLSGIGRLEVETDKREIEIGKAVVHDTMLQRDVVAMRTRYKVSSNKKHIREAIENSAAGYSLRQVGDDYLLVRPTRD